MAPEMNTPLPTSAVTSWTLTRPAGPVEGRIGEDRGEGRRVKKGEEKKRGDMRGEEKSYEVMGGDRIRVGQGV